MLVGEIVLTKLVEQVAEEVALEVTPLPLTSKPPDHYKGSRSWGSWVRGSFRKEAPWEELGLTFQGIIDILNVKQSKANKFSIQSLNVSLC